MIVKDEELIALARESAEELFQMAQASGKYRRFKYISPSIRKVWNQSSQALDELSWRLSLRYP